MKLTPFQPCAAFLGDRIQDLSVPGIDQVHKVLALIVFPYTAKAVVNSTERAVELGYLIKDLSVAKHSFCQLRNDGLFRAFMESVC